MQVDNSFNLRPHQSTSYLATTPCLSTSRLPQRPSHQVASSPVIFPQNAVFPQKKPTTPVAKRRLAHQPSLGLAHQPSLGVARSWLEPRRWATPAGGRKKLVVWKLFLGWKINHLQWMFLLTHTKTHISNFKWIVQLRPSFRGDFPIQT